MNEEVLDMLAEICEDDVVREDRDVELFDSGLIDSLAFTELLVEMEDRFGVSVSPTEVDRSDLNTPNKIISYFESRVER